MQVIAPEGAEADLPKIVEQLMGQEEDSSKQDEVSEASTSSSTNEKKSLDSKFPLDGKIPVGGIGADVKDTPIRLVVGGVLQNSVDSESPKLPIRVPAKLEYQGRDSFVFHIEESGNSAGGTASKEMAPSWKVATIATQSSADLMPDDVAKALWNVEKVPVKVSRLIQHSKLPVLTSAFRSGLCIRCTISL